MPLTSESDGQSTFDPTRALQKAKEKGLSTQLMDSFDEEWQMQPEKGPFVIQP